MATLKPLTEGQAVHYVQQLEGQVGTTQYGAIVSRVHDEGIIDLFAFMENTPVPIRNVPYSHEELPGTWHHIF